MGFDARIARAMLKLGYRVFPFEAFDRSGNLKLAQVDFPPDVDAGLGRIASNPLWGDLYRTLSPLAAEGVFMAGIGFLNDRVQVALFRATTSVPNPAAAMNWASAYHGTVEATLHGYAGRAYLLDPNLRKVIDKARGYLPPSGQGVGADDLGAGYGDSDADTTIQTEDEYAPAAEQPVAATGINWVALGLDLLGELLVNVTVRTKVLTTVCWYPPSVADQPFASRWRPIHAANLQTGVLTGHRSAHLLWNPVGSPVIWSGAGVSWKGPGLDMPAAPAQWCQALRPLANCLGSPLTASDASEVLTASDASEVLTASDVFDAPQPT
ncbi:MAG TPA: hypothetical protein VGB75_17090 [Jatrophihabitans sp.]|uniref:hypothetical protein n=1 Tax=Jatrophihabitans sp. TaxID=1932789 RepID=UPI002F0269AA